jgi:hypothetical protein
MNLTGQAIYQKQDKHSDDPKHIARVRAMNCCICEEYGLPQLSATQAHHCIHGRYSTRRTPDRMAIPICEGHHQGDFDTSKVALHREPAKWKRLYGPDTNWISWVEARL